MPAKRVRTRPPVPIERAVMNVRAALPDPKLGLKPFYTVYCVCPDGLWILIFDHKIRERVNDAIIQARTSQLIVHTMGEKVEFRSGVPIKDELLKVFRVLRLGDKGPKVQPVYSGKPPMLSVLAYHAEKSSPPLDLQLIQLEVPINQGELGSFIPDEPVIPQKHEVDVKQLMTSKRIESIQHSFVLWDTQMMLDLGYDPKSDDSVRCYFSEEYRDTRAPILIRHLPAVKEFCTAYMRSSGDTDAQAHPKDGPSTG